MSEPYTEVCDGCSRNKSECDCGKATYPTRLAWVEAIKAERDALKAERDKQADLIAHLQIAEKGLQAESTALRQEVAERNASLNAFRTALAKVEQIIQERWELRAEVTDVGEDTELSYRMSEIECLQHELKPYFAILAGTPEPTALTCMDCGCRYEATMPCSLNLSRKQWLEINPDDGGLLCANCIVRRAEKIANVICLNATIMFAHDFESAPETTTQHCSNCGADGGRGDYCDCDCSVCVSNDSPTTQPGMKEGT